ncbi:LuxR family two component transcriptional regulator [Stackebrandtia albiflava]|uniref:LuxR family two component transcriptional regulator n=1 Tax=Stackebrandtia albiflava TaxID=406432 RepID=A0A562VDF1_9ACTN|nr:response regulator transcription factor [Stackebrandtia albiflava]TWJ15841.1 LuxR family two component transcriptional regulator [Stackebrandtia albiflava]
MTAPIRIMLVDDHPVVRRGLRTFLELQPDMTVVAEAADGAAALRSAAEAAPDVMLLDLRMPGLSGREVLAELGRRGDPVRVIVLTSVTEAGEVAPAMEAGAAGFLYKDVDPDVLARAVRSVHDGQTLLAPAAMAAISAVPPQDATGLTGREREVLRLVAAGLSNRQIARRLTVAEKTVKTHLTSVFRKIGVVDRTQAALWAVRHGLAE